MENKGKPEGKFSHTMGVNTKPAHRFKVGPHWVLIDGNMPQKQFQKIVETLLDMQDELANLE